MRVLVASESAAVRARATSALQSAPEVDVVEASSASEAHRALREGGVDVAVIDGDMRPEGGYSLIYETRAAAELQGEQAVAMIVLYEREQDRWLASWAGATDAFHKPVDPLRLAERVVELAQVPV